MKSKFNPLAAGALILAANEIFGGKKPKKLPKQAADILNRVLKESCKNKSSIEGML